MYGAPNQKWNSQQSIDEHFDSIASKYNATTEWRQNQKITSWFSHFLRNQGRCLDLATGTGIIGEQLQKSAIPFVVGIDRSWKMLQNAKLTVGNVVCGDALMLPFPNSSFDAVSVRQFLHYADDRACLREVARVAIPEGLLACAHVTAPDKELAQWWREIKQIVQPLRQRFYAAKEMETLIEDSGFKVERVDSMKIIRQDPWERFFVNCKSDDDVRAIHEMLDKTPEDIIQRISLQILPDRLVYTQFWTLIIGRRDKIR